MPFWSSRRIPSEPKLKVKEKWAYLFLLLITCSFAIIFIHYKSFGENEGLFASTEKSVCSCEDQKRNSEDRIPSSSVESKDTKVCPSSPSSLMEQTRRHISQTVRHQRLFMVKHIRILHRVLAANSTKNFDFLKYENTLNYMLDHGSEYSRVIELELKKLADLDGWNEWRKREGEELRKIIRNRLFRLQNPANCTKSPVLVCNMTSPYGFASGIHDVLWCFVKAYTDHRRLVLETSHWQYAPGGWETFFQPLSETCQDNQDLLQNRSSWPGRNGDKHRRLLRTIPRDLGIRIIRLHGNPLAWWYGQFLWYLMRPNNQLQSFINNTMKSINFTKGIVGIHVRRTDKVGNEAKAHKLEEYMQHAEEYFQSLELVSRNESIRRRVYIATDEPSVVKECQEKYPQYECLYNPGSAEMASNMNTRYSNQSLWWIVTDIIALAQTDFIVCTMSSGVCRVAYELKLAFDENPADVSDGISSLDVPHHYAWITPASRKAIYNHKAKSLKEISFMRGDVLVHKDDHTIIYAAVRGKVLDGFMKMINKIKNTEGLVPIYKTREMFQLRN